MINIVQTVIQSINLLFIIFVLFFERKESTRRFVWLMLLLFLPGLGIIIYILFSGHFFTGSRRMREVHQVSGSLAQALCNTQQEILKENLDKFLSKENKEFSQLIDMNLNKGNSPIAATETAEIYTDGKDFFEELCVSLQNAKKSIYMEYFIFHEDTIGKRIMDILCQKAKEGLDVKLIYDDLGSIRTRTRFFRRLNESGGAARPFFQIRLGLPFTLNYRNHRKVSVIDGDIGFIGGANIGDEYANQKKRGKLNWRDTVVRITGNSVLIMETKFLLDWYGLDAWSEHTKTLEDAKKFFPSTILPDLEGYMWKQGVAALTAATFSPGHIPTQIITSGPSAYQASNIEDALIRMILSAKKNVYIQTPYFTPDDEFCRALKIASYSGVEVHIIIPGEWDKFYMKAASSEFAREMLDNKIHFYLYPGFIHSKMITIDGKIASIGTTNIDVRSFSLHFEENAIFYDTKFALQCEEIFRKDIECAPEVFKEDFDNQFILKRTFWSFCKLFSPLM